ncbi:T9SS type A sorting domain-containing protein [bacterium]|nr:T9SS type A sorting domain-containing protein [bacterium]
MKSFYNLLVCYFIIVNSLLSQDGNTPTNFQVDAASIGGVQLSWETPENFRREWISHSNLQYFGGIGASSTPAFYCHKFPDSLLSDYHGMLVKDIAFVPSADSDSASFQPLVFETDSSGLIPDIVGRTNLVLSAPKVSFSENTAFENEWNTIQLKNHVPGQSIENDVIPSTYEIDSTKTLWFGYWLYDYVNFPAGADIGPANESLGNVIIWCPVGGCFESTLNLSAQEGSSLDFDWLLSISLLPGDNSEDSREVILSNSNNNMIPNSSIYNYSMENVKIDIGPLKEDVWIEPINSNGRDISNYFVFENGVVADVVQPDYVNFNTTIRESSLLGPRNPGIYSYYVRAQTAEGLSDSSNVVSVELVNTLPGSFDMIAPENGINISVTSSNINIPNMFIWTNSVDTDGQELTYSFEMCSISDNAVCFDTSMTERILQLTNQSIIENLNLTNGNYDLSWTVNVSDGIDITTIGGSGSDSIRYLTFSVDQLEVDNPDMPIEYSLRQNYPNPFNPSTTISYKLGKSEFVNLSVFDLNGNLVKNILNHKADAGRGYVEWDGKNEQGQNVSGGIYLYVIETPSFLKSKKMLFLK